MSDIFGIGTDLVEISRMETMKNRDSFLERYFTENEIDYIRKKRNMSGQTIAGIYAAKEAASKAMGTGLACSMKEIEVLHRENGMPYYHLTGKAAELSGGGNIHLSVSHDGGIAVAFCVIENKEA